MAAFVFTKNITTGQDAKLQKRLVRINEERAAQGLSPLADNAAYLDFVLTEAVKSYLEQERDEEEAVVRAAYRNATPVKQAEVKAALGVT